MLWKGPGWAWNFESPLGRTWLLEDRSCVCVRLYSTQHGMQYEVLLRTSRVLDHFSDSYFVVQTKWSRICYSSSGLRLVGGNSGQPDICISKV